MKVLITGGAGYIGSHCNRYFVQQGIETVVLDDLSDGHQEAVFAGRFVQGDFGDNHFIDLLMAEENFDAILHFAAFADVADSVSDPARYYDNNVTKLLSLMNAAVAHGIRYVVFSSSAATYGEPKYVPIDEKHTQEPINPYGITKLIGEHILKDYEKAYGIRYCTFRYFNAAGDSTDSVIGESHDPEHHIIPLVIRAAKGKTEELKVFGNDYPTKDGSCLRDYVHVNDLADAHYRGLCYIMDHDCSEDFNLGSDTGFTVLELIRKFEELTGQHVPYKMADRRAGDPAALVAANQKAKELLGWNPRYSDIETILTDAWNWENHKKY